MSYEMSTSVAASNQVLTPDDIQNEISSHVSSVQFLLKITSSQSLALLLKFKWDIDALRESFHASQDLSEFLIDNNVVLNTHSEAPTHPECQLCLAVEDVEGLACGHMACSSCWKTYLKNKIESGNPSIECFDCSMLICNDKLKALLRKSQLLTVYQELIVDSYVRNDSNLTWCSKTCGNAVRRIGSNNVFCSCGVKFCFQCKRNPHTPASCDQMILWEKSCEDYKELGKFTDKKSWKWIRDNTQECPRCWVSIQKNGGCIHMYCEKCKHHFCWNCRGTWTEWHGYSCPYQKTRIVYPNQRKIAPYLLPFNYHKQKLDNTNDFSSIFECRRTLMYSYVYSYYQGSGKITKDFKQLQKRLRDELDLEKSKQSLEKCKQLRMSILEYCSSSQTGKKLVKSKRKECCNSIFVVFLVLLLCCILAGIITVTVLFFV